MRMQEHFNDDLWVGMAVAVAMKAHEGQVDKGNLPYFDHPWTVGSMMREDGFSRGYQIVALLHDVVEDTPMTLDGLSDYGFHQSVVSAVDAISKRKGESLGQYLDRLGENKVAVEVKRYDVWHNLSPVRLSQIPDGDKQRLVRKYTSTLNFLYDVHLGRPMSGDSD